MQNTQTTTKALLAEHMINNGFESKKKALLFIDNMIDEIFHALKSNGKLKIYSFGTFVIQDKKEREGRNPKTGEKAAIPAHKRVGFRASQALKKSILKSTKK